MPNDPLSLEAETQEVLDDLWSQKLIPFPLTVGKITKAPGEYTIDFYDSRIGAARLPLVEGQSFKDMLRAAVLARVAKLSGP